MTSTKYSYQIEPRSVELGGGWPGHTPTPSPQPTNGSIQGTSNDDTSEKPEGKGDNDG